MQAPQNEVPSQARKIWRWVAVCGCLLVVIAVITIGAIVGFLSLFVKVMTELARWL